MPLDHVRFCADRYLRDSFGFHKSAVRQDLADEATRLIGAAQAGDAGAVIGVQTIAEGSDAIAFAVTANGLFLTEFDRYVPFSSIVGIDPQNCRDKQNFRAIDLDLNDGSTVRLNVDSARGRFRDAFTVLRFLKQVLRRLQQTHPAYQPSV